METQYKMYPGKQTLEIIETTVTDGVTTIYLRKTSTREPFQKKPRDQWSTIGRPVGSKSPWAPEKKKQPVEKPKKPVGRPTGCASGWSPEKKGPRKKGGAMWSPIANDLMFEKIIADDMDKYYDNIVSDDLTIAS